MALLLYRFLLSLLAEFRVASSPAFCGSGSHFLKPFDDELPENRPRRCVEAICSCRFLKLGNPFTPFLPWRGGSAGSETARLIALS